MKPERIQLTAETPKSVEAPKPAEGRQPTWGIYQTLPFDSFAARLWHLGKSDEGIWVAPTSRVLDELAISFYFVLPELTLRGGTVTLLSVARGIAGDASGLPRFWDPVALREVCGGVYAHVTYNPMRERFEVRMNVGNVTSQLLGVVLEGATPELVGGRLLECYVEISPDRIFASVHNHFGDGDLAFDDISPATGDTGCPWGVSPSGSWRVIIGLADESEESWSTLPAGFGLSDLRITLGSEVDQSLGSLAYSGALDHLVGVRRPEISELVVPALDRHAESLRSIARELERLRMLYPSSPSAPVASLSAL